MAKIVMVIAPKDFRDEEFKYPYEILSKKNIGITIASQNRGVCTGMFGTHVTADISLEDIIVDEYDGIVLVGGGGATIYQRSKILLNKIVHFFNAGKLVAAICIAPTILALAGVLNGKNATVWHSPESDGILVKNGAILSNKHVIQDGTIITGDGPESAKKFGKAVYKYLK